MFAVIRAGGKQYRVAPGDIIRIETPSAAKNGTVNFSAADVLAVSTEAGKIASGDATVTGEVMEQGRGNKIIVFKFKRKKQYKKTIGHRQNFSAVRITEINFGGEKFSAPELSKKKKKSANVLSTVSQTGTVAGVASGAADEIGSKTAVRKKTPAKKTAAKKSTKK